MKQEITSLQTLQDIIQNEIGVLLYFSTPTCNVCKALKPKISQEFKSNFPKIKQVYIDASLSKDIAAYYHVFSVPTILVFLDSKEFARESRNVSISLLTGKIKRIYNILMG